MFNFDDPAPREPRQPAVPRLPQVGPPPVGPSAPVQTPSTTPPVGPSAPPGGEPKIANTNQDTDVMPADAIGDIPPPPIPSPPIVGPGIAGIPGTEAGTLARPGQRAAQPFRSAAFAPVRPRFGPGVPVTGGGGIGGDVGGLGLDPDQAAEILRTLADGGGPLR